jgi:hypothetical protein
LDNPRILALIALVLLSACGTNAAAPAGDMSLAGAPDDGTSDGNNDAGGDDGAPRTARPFAAWRHATRARRTTSAGTAAGR